MVRVICDSARLEEGGCGVRFLVRRSEEVLPAFVVRYGGNVFAYLNRCAHQRVELDWMPGEFFDAERRHLVCATHGALYFPDSGRCAGGRCIGEGGLVPLDVAEEDGRVVLKGEHELHC